MVSAHVVPLKGAVLDCDPTMYSGFGTIGTLRSGNLEI